MQPLHLSYTGHKKDSLSKQAVLSIVVIPNWGRIGFDGDVETKVAGRGAAGLVKSGTKVIANNDYDYAYAA